MVSNKEELPFLKRKGTKKQYKKFLQNRRVKSFLNQRLGTQTHVSGKDYSRPKEKENLRFEIREKMY